MPRLDICYEYGYKRKLDNYDLPLKLQNGQMEYFQDILNKNDMNYHYFQVTKLEEGKRNKITAGFFINNFGLGFKYAQKHLFNNTDTFRIIGKYDSNNLRIKNKVKHKITQNNRSEVNKK